MLVLSRRLEESLKIGDQIEIKVLDIFTTDDSGSRKSKVASIGIEAPKDIPILRGELVQTLRQNQEAERTARDLSGSGLAGLLKQKRKLTDLGK